jgi:hypothetical protein
MKGPKDFPLTDEEKASVKAKTEMLEKRAENGGPWPALMGPIHAERRVFDAILKDLLDSGWNAEFSHEGMLVIHGLNA